MVLENFQDLDQILNDFKQRLADGIVDAVTKFKDNLLDSTKEIVEEKLNWRITLAPPALLPKPRCSLRIKSLSH